MGEDGWYYYNDVDMDDATKVDVESTYSDTKFLPIYQSPGIELRQHVNLEFSDYSYHDYYYSIFTEMDDAYLDQSNFELTGSLPKSLNEIVIPKNFYEQLRTHGYVFNDEIFEINTPSDILGQTLTIVYDQFTIVGIIDYKDDLSRYDSLKEINRINNTTPQLYWSYRDLHQNGTIGLLVFAEGYNQYIREQASQKMETRFNKDGDYFLILNTIRPMDQVINSTVTYFNGISSDNLTSNDIIIGESQMRFIASNTVPYEINEQIRYEYVLSHFEDELTTVLHDRYPMYDSIEDIPEAQRQSIVLNELLNDILTAEIIVTLYGVVLDYFMTNEIPQSHDVSIFKNYYDHTIETNLRIVGYTTTPNTDLHYFVSKTLYDEIVEVEALTYVGLITEIQHLKRLDFNQMVSQNMDREKLFKVIIKDDNISFLVDLSRNVYGMRTFFFWTAVVLAAFSGLLMFSFISSSINYSKQEIGILRAIGASSYDVLGIFSKETLMISVVNAGIAMIGTVLMTGVLNETLYTNLNIQTSLFDFGIRQVILVTGLSVVIGYLSSALPVLKTARKKPIDAIKNK